MIGSPYQRILGADYRWPLLKEGKPSKRVNHSSKDDAPCRRLALIKPEFILIDNLEKYNFLMVTYK